jgi:hypothetical protein
VTLYSPLAGCLFKARPVGHMSPKGHDAANSTEQCLKYLEEMRERMQHEAGAPVFGGFVYG